MDFLRTILVSILLFNFGHSFSPQGVESVSKELDRLLEQLIDLKDQLNLWFKTNHMNCSGSIDNNQEYLGTIYKYLKNNQTNIEKGQEKNNTISHFFDELKDKIFKLIHHKNSTESSQHVRRCINKSVKIPKNNSSDSQNFHQYLTKVIACLEKSRKNGKLRDGDDDLELAITIEESNEKKSPIEREETANASKLDNFLKYMADSKHTVEETGRAGFRPPDLQRTQEIIDTVKSSMININFDDDESTTSTTCDPFAVNTNDLRKRNIFEDFVGQFENKLPKLKGTGVNDEMFDEIDEDSNKQEVPVDEESLLGNDLNFLSSKLDSEQQMAITSFLDQINQKPKQFKFDVRPYMQSSLENILKKTQQQPLDESQPKKFFDFDAKKKRGIKNQHRDNFIDPRVFNDGSVPTDQIISKFHINPKHILTPQDVDRNFKLEKIFKELQFDEHEHERESAPEIPFYKTERVDDETAEIEALA